MSIYKETARIVIQVNWLAHPTTYFITYTVFGVKKHSLLVYSKKSF